MAGAVVSGGVARWIAGLRDPEVSPVLAVAASLIGLATLPLAVFVFLVSAGCLDGTGCWG